MSISRAVPRLPALPATRLLVSPRPQAGPRRGLGGGLPAPASRASATRHASASHGGVAPAGGGDQAPSSRAGRQRTGSQASRPDERLFMPRLPVIASRGGGS